MPALCKVPPPRCLPYVRTTDVRLEADWSTVQPTSMNAARLLRTPSLPLQYLVHLHAVRSCTPWTAVRRTACRTTS